MRSVVILLFLCGIAAHAAAQPVITSSSLVPPGGGVLQSKQYDVLGGQAELAALLAATGPNQTYDFAQFAYAPATTYMFEVKTSASGTPGELDATLNTANYVLLGPNTVGTETFSYWVLDGSGYRSLGNVIVYDSNTDGEVDTTWTVHDPPQTHMVLPLMVGSEWTETVTSSTRSVFGMGSTSQEIHGEVEGWGSLVLPDRTLDALRLRRTFTQTAGGFEISFSFIEFKTTSTYQASISTDLTGNPQAASYSHGEQDGGVGTEESATVGFELMPNYPNPFRGETVIPIVIAKPGVMRISVIDLLGREVARPLDGFVSAGRHDVRFDAASLSSGLYVYRLSSGAGIRTGQMVVRR